MVRVLLNEAIEARTRRQRGPKAGLKRCDWERAVPVPVRERKANERFHEYTLVAKLGAGGMGETWLARKDGLDKKVVLKMMRPELAEVPQAHQYFTAEGALGAKLHHANIVNLIGRNTFEGVSYLVLEYVEGKDLEFLLGKFTRLSPEWAVYIASETLNALGYVHGATIGGQHGEIVHRDVTPDNIFLSAAAEVKLGDWGIAQVRSALRERTKIPGAIKGKYKYLSPEMARGEPVDHRADIFQVGLVLYEMLTGTAAFSGTRAGTEAIARCEYRRIPTVVNDVPPQLVAAVEQLMQSQPRDRPQTAALADELIKEACPTFFRARRPIAEAVLRLTDVSVSSTFAVPDALRAMYSAAGVPTAAPPDPPPQVVLTAGASERTLIPLDRPATPMEPINEAPPRIDEKPNGGPVAGTPASPTPVSPRRQRRSLARPTYVKPLPVEGIRERKRPTRWPLFLGLAGLVAVGVILPFVVSPHPQASAPAPTPPQEVAVVPARPQSAPTVPAPPAPAAPAPVAAPPAPAPVAKRPKRPPAAKSPQTERDRGLQGKSADSGKDRRRVVLLLPYTTRRNLGSTRWSSSGAKNQPLTTRRAPRST